MLDEVQINDYCAQHARCFFSSEHYSVSITSQKMNLINHKVKRVMREFAISLKKV